MTAGRATTHIRPGRAQVVHVVFHGALDPVLRTRGIAREALAPDPWQSRHLANSPGFHLRTQPEIELTADVASSVPRFVFPKDRCTCGSERLPDASDAKREILGGPVVSFIGRLPHKKAVERLARAIPRVAEAIPDVRIMLAGLDAEAQGRYVRRQESQLGVADRREAVDIA